MEWSRFVEFPIRHSIISEFSRSSAAWNFLERFNQSLIGTWARICDTLRKVWLSEFHAFPDGELGQFSSPHSNVAIAGLHDIFP